MRIPELSEVIFQILKNMRSHSSIPSSIKTLTLSQNADMDKRNPV